MKLAAIFFCLTFIYSSYGKQYLCDFNAKCGCSQKPAVLKKIVGGIINQDVYWGWVVSIKNNNQLVCGGSVLSSSWILTTVSCVQVISHANLTVSAGSNNIKSSTQTRLAAEIILHPNYEASTLINDIALIRLKTPLDMDDPSVTQICLPSQTTNDYLSDKSSLLAISWGVSYGPIIKDFKDERYGQLREVPVKAVPNDHEDCQDLINDVSAQLCARVVKPYNDTCVGDGGNPLMVYTSRRQWIIVGLVSYGVGCDGEYPGVYTRVSNYLDWIKSLNVVDAITINKK